MFIRSVLLWCFALFILDSTATAGEIHEVTSRNGENDVTYQVRFGGGKLMDQYTAFDPDTKSFVYLSWMRTDEAPKPVMTIWNHRDGELLTLYKFPDAKHPLPIIPNMSAIKVCPLTGDKSFNSRLIIFVD